MHALQAEATSDTKYEDMAEIYNIVWLINKLKFLRAGVDSHINKIYSTFHNLKDFYMIHQNSGDTVTNYSDHFKSSRVNVELSKGNLTKHEELEKSERDDGNTTNLEKLAEDKF